jgi:hypothetical protein
MADWEELRELTHQMAPPDFESLAWTARHRQRRARAALGVFAGLVLFGGGIGVAAVVDDDKQILQPAGDPSSDLPDGVLALPDDDPGEDFASLDAGRYRIALDDTLAFDVDVPDKTYSHSDGLFLSTGPVVLKTEIAGESYGVPDNACQDNDIEAVGPTVTDLVTAIHDTRPYRVSAPEHVRFAGARGTYLEIRIPAGYDATPCHDHLVALPGNPGTYNNLEPGYIGKWWILDVDGQRVVVQQNCLCAPQRLDGADSIPRSIAFTPSS